METQLSLPQKGTVPPIFSPYPLRPNGCIDQDATWPRRLCVRLGPRSSLHKKEGRAPSPIFGPFLLWPNGCMHQDATWYGGRPQPRGFCVTWGPNPLPKKEVEPRGGAQQFSAHVYCGQTNGWMDQDGTWNGGSPWPVHIVLDGDTAPLPQNRGQSAPSFRPIFIAAKRLD